MKKTLIPAALAIAVASMLAAGTFVSKVAADNDNDDSDRFAFKPDTLVLSRSVYAGNASTVTIGQTLPPGCSRVRSRCRSLPEARRM